MAVEQTHCQLRPDVVGDDPADEGEAPSRATDPVVGRRLRRGWARPLGGGLALGQWRQPSSYDPVRDTISAAGRLGRPTAGS